MKELVRKLLNEPASVRKFILALLAAVITAVSLGALPASVGTAVAIATAFLNALGVYAIRNDENA